VGSDSVKRTRKKEKKRKKDNEGKDIQIVIENKE